MITNLKRGRPQRAARTKWYEATPFFEDSNSQAGAAAEGRPRQDGMKRLGLLLWIFLLSCSFNSGAAQEVTLERAQTLLKHGAYKQAAEAFAVLLQKNSNDRDAQIGVTAALFESGDCAGAEKRVKEFLAAQPGEAALRVWLGEVELETGRYSESLSEFERAARTAKGAVWLRAMLGPRARPYSAGKGRGGATNTARDGPILRAELSHHS